MNSQTASEKFESYLIAMEDRPEIAVALAKHMAREFVDHLRELELKVDRVNEAQVVTEKLHDATFKYVGQVQADLIALAEEIELDELTPFQTSLAIRDYAAYFLEDLTR